MRINYRTVVRKVWEAGGDGPGDRPKRGRIEEVEGSGWCKEGDHWCEKSGNIAGAREFESLSAIVIKLILNGKVKGFKKL